MARPIASLLADIDEPISELGSAEIAAAVADGLLSLSGQSNFGRATIDIRAVELVRDYLVAHASEQTPASILEKIAGIDRFTIARQFRWAFGTSPDRYRTLRPSSPHNSFLPYSYLERTLRIRLLSLPTVAMPEVRVIFLSKSRSGCQSSEREMEQRGTLVRTKRNRETRMRISMT